MDAPGFAKRAKLALQVDGVAEQLEGEIQKLSSLVGRLKVRIKSYCQTEVLRVDLTHNPVTRLKQFSPSGSLSKYVLSCDVFPTPATNVLGGLN